MEDTKVTRRSIKTVNLADVVQIPPPSAQGNIDVLPVFWYIVKEENTGVRKLYDIEHFDQGCADSKIREMRIGEWNAGHPEDALSLVRICSPKENRWINNLKRRDPFKFKELEDGHENWPEINLRKFVFPRTYWMIVYLESFARMNMHCIRAYTLEQAELRKREYIDEGNINRDPGTKINFIRMLNEDESDVISAIWPKKKYRQLRAEFVNMLNDPAIDPLTLAISEGAC